MIKRDLVVAVLAMFCLVTALLVMIPSKSAAPGREYDPWCDINNDGQVNLKDIFAVAKAFGTTGDPSVKASILFDSGWVNITDKAGQYIPIVHNLNSTDIIVDVTGKTTLEGGVHQRHFGLTGCTPGWSRTYGGTKDDWPFSIIQTLDGGYAITGYTESFGAGGQDFWLVKTYADGDVEWNKTYGNATHNEVGRSLIQTTDGGYAIAGYTGRAGVGAEGWDCWLVKTDDNGNMQWNRTYAYTQYHDEARCVIQTDDGGYIIAGSTYYAPGNSASDGWLVKTDAAGNMIWNKTYGDADINSPDWFTSMIQTKDGGYAITGSTYSFGVQDSAV